MKAAINGFQLAYEVLGTHGIPVVLIHGYGLNRSIWKSMAVHYLEQYQVILPDVRGHGESEAVEGSYSMMTLAEDIIGLLDFLGFEKVVICGHSMGGYIVLALAERFPQRLSGLGLITTHAGADTEAKQTERYQMAEKVRLNGSVVLANSLAPKLTKDPDLVRDIHNIISNTDPYGIIGVSLGMAERPDHTSLLGAIKVPALVAAGEDDQLISIEDARKMAEALPNGKFYLIKNAAHMPMLEQPQSLANGLDALISSIKNK